MPGELEAAGGTSLYFRIRHENYYGSIRLGSYLLDIDLQRSPITATRETDDQRVTLEVSCYPNPARELVQLEIVSPGSPRIMIQLLDSAGRVVKRVVANAAARQVVGLNASDLSSGIYWCRVSNGEVQLAKAVVIQR